MIAMNRFNIDDIYWLLGRLSKSIGIFGLFGVALIVACVLLFFTHVLPVRTQLNEAKYALAHAQASLANAVQEQVPTPPVAENSKTQEVAEFYQIFPAGVTLPKQIELIEKMALKEKLTLNHGDYKLTKTKKGQLMRYEITFPMVGNYTQIRQFVADILQKMPALALSDLQIKRENVASPIVQARLVFTLFLQGDSWLK
jgi:Tfp pilus assembly protein PilO